MTTEKKYTELTLYDGVPAAGDWVHIIRVSESNPSLQNRRVTMDNLLRYAATLEGPTGPTGETGAAGSDGADGATWLSGSGAPSDGSGANGDFYLDTSASAWYGPKAAGTWSGTGPNSLIGATGATGDTGPQGPQGDTGPAGSDGTDGALWYSGSGAPSDGTGVDGDYYMDVTAGAYYGPKNTGTWSGTGPHSLVGPTGATGDTGPQGPQGDTGYGMPTGGTTGQAIIKASGTDYDFAWGSPTVTADAVSYDNSTSEMAASDLQAAVDEFAALNVAMKAGTGFPNQTDSTISKVDGTRTFSIAPAVTSFDYYLDGIKKTVSSQQDVVWTDVEGEHHFYFDADGTGLKHTATFSTDLITEHAYVANLYWDQTNSVALRFGEERHGMVMDPVTHAYMHAVMGAMWVSGLGLTGMTIDGDGSSNTHLQLAVNDGAIRDEDILNTITGGSPQTLSAIAQIPVFYLSGATPVWRKKTADDYPVIYNGTAGYSGTYPAYNQYTGGSWTLTDIGNNNYVLVHMFATNDKVEPVIAILGQEVYATVPAARAAANNEINTIVLSGLPSQEYSPIATFIVKGSSTYTNTPKGTIVSTDDGSDYIDWRGIPYSPSGGISSADHGNLAGLSDDDHPQYLTEARADALYADISHTHAGVYEPAFSKNTAFNQNFGTGASDVCVGNDSRLSDARTPTSHNNTYHSETYITAAGVTFENLQANGDVGTGSAQVSQGNHTHSYLANVVEDTTPQLGGDLDCQNKDIDNAATVTFNSEYDNGTKSGGWTLDWNNGQYQKFTMSATQTVAFTAPPGPATLRVKITQSGASNVLTLPTGKWAGGTPGTNSTGDGDIDLLSVYYDGSSYWYELSKDWA